EKRLTGKKISNNANFIDFKNQKFKQYYDLDTNLLNINLGLNFKPNKTFFFDIKLLNEIYKNQYNVNLVSNFGFNF
ncbi:TPA: hypothetical protein R1707_000749, partial [Campylobacter lari]|nr:hypothetical protein [Campylobacter lari]